MKIFQILNDICYWEATNLGTIDEVRKLFAPDIMLVEAPDYVFPGWGYLDGEFIKPVAPEGWEYNDENGTFTNLNPPEPQKTEIEIALETLMDGLI